MRLVVSRGITLIELMIVVAILAIISLFAVSSYRNYIRDAKITTAVQELSRVAGEIETLRIKGHRYDSKKTKDFVKEAVNSEVRYKGDVIYTIVLKETPLNVKEYTLMATLKDTSQKDFFDKCAELTINSMGNRGPDKCW